MKNILRHALFGALTLMTLTGCGNGGSKISEDEIVFLDKIPNVELGAEFDFSPYFYQLDGWTYEMEASYEDDYGNEQELTVSDYRFTQNVFSDVYVTVYGHKEKGNKDIEGYTVLTVVANPDYIDQWLYNIYLMEQNYVTKTLNYDARYRNGGRSSLKFNYYGKKFSASTPCSFLTLLDYQNNERFTLRTGDDESLWENAVFSFDVYNPNDYDLTISLTLETSQVKTNYWNASDVYVCKPGQWKHYDVSFRSLGQTDPLRFDAEWADSDHFYLQFLYAGNSTKQYTDFDFYLDNVDINTYDAEKFPDLDTTYYQEGKDIFTQDENICAYDNEDKTSGDEMFDSSMRAESTSRYSLKTQCSPYKGGDGKCRVYSFISGSTFGWKPMCIADMKVDFYLYANNVNPKVEIVFDSDYGTETDVLTIDLEKGSGNGWSAVKQENGWYKVHFDVSEIDDIQNAAIEYEWVRRMIISYTNTGIDRSLTSNLWLDSLTLTDARVTKYPFNAWEDPSPISQGTNY